VGGRGTWRYDVPPMTPPTEGRLARAAIVLLLAWTLAVTVLRAVRWPNDFAEAHWLLDYRLGLIKRGLPGELLALATRLVGGRPTEGLIADISLLVFAAFVVALLAIVLRLVAGHGWSAAAVLAGVAVLSSSYVVMAAHLMGYFDHLVVLLGAAAVASLLRGRPWWAGSALAVSVLVHEQTLVMGYPVACLAWLQVNDRRHAAGERRLPALPLAVPLVVFGALAIAGARMSADVFQDTFTRHLESYPFVGGDMHLFVPEWLSVGLIESAGGQLHRFVERLASRDILVLIIPTVLALVTLTVDRRASGSRLRTVVLAAAVLAPQTLHMAGWDTVRIWTYSIVAALLCAWILAETGHRRPVQTSPAVPLVAVTALILNVMLVTPLYDNLNERFALVGRAWLYLPVLVGCIWVLALRRGPEAEDVAPIYPADGV